MNALGGAGALETGDYIKAERLGLTAQGKGDTHTHNFTAVCDILMQVLRLL